MFVEICSCWSDPQKKLAAAYLNNHRSTSLVSLVSKIFGTLTEKLVTHFDDDRLRNKKQVGFRQREQPLTYFSPRHRYGVRHYMMGGRIFCDRMDMAGAFDIKWQEAPSAS